MGKKRTHSEAQDGFQKSTPVKDKNNTFKGRKKNHVKKSAEGHKPALVRNFGVHIKSLLR
jgi:ribosome biogenesis protein MAK21